MLVPRGRLRMLTTATMASAAAPMAARMGASARRGLAWGAISSLGSTAWVRIFISSQNSTSSSKAMR